MRDSGKTYTVLGAVGADGAGSPIYVGDHRNIIIEVSFAAATCSLKFAGALSDVSGASPDFDSSADVDNPWDYIEAVDLQNGNATDGDTGISASAASEVRLFELNTNGMRWFNAIVSSWSAGAITVKVRLFNNQ